MDKQGRFRKEIAKIDKKNKHEATKPHRKYWFKSLDNSKLSKEEREKKLKAIVEVF